MLPKAILQIALPVVFLAACSTGEQYEAVNRSQGGVRAKVVDILSSDQVATLHVPCMPLMAPEGEQLQWLRTEFRRDHMRSSVVTLAYDGQQIGLNSPVEIKAQFCDEGKLYQVVRVLKRLPAP